MVYNILLNAPVLIGAMFLCSVVLPGIRTVCARELVIGAFAFILCIYNPHVQLAVVWFVVALLLCYINLDSYFRKPKCCLLFAAVLSIFLDSCYLLSFRFVCFVDTCLSSLLHVNLPRVGTTGVLAVLYGGVLLLAHKYKIMTVDHVRMISAKPINIFVSMFGLLVMILFRCHIIKIEHHTEHYEFMWNVMLFMIIVYFTTYGVMRKISKLHAVDVNYTVDTAIGKALCSSECSLDFRLPDKTFAYEREKLHFSCELSRFGLDYGFLGYSQLVLCLIVLSNTKHEESEIDRIVCSCMEPFADLSKKNIFGLLDDILANARLVEKIDPDTYEHIDDDVKTGREMLKYFLKVA